jgi:hypothetical protein
LRITSSTIEPAADPDRDQRDAEVQEDPEAATPAAVDSARDSSTRRRRRTSTPGTTAPIRRQVDGGSGVPRLAGARSHGENDRQGLDPAVEEPDGHLEQTEPDDGRAGDRRRGRGRIERGRGRCRGSRRIGRGGLGGRRRSRGRAGRRLSRDRRRQRPQDEGDHDERRRIEDERRVTAADQEAADRRADDETDVAEAARALSARPSCRSSVARLGR